MMQGRLRECLRILRWSEADLAAALGCQPAEARAWLDGRGRAPLAVAAWLETLVKAHLAVPPPLGEGAGADGQAFAPIGQSGDSRATGKRRGSHNSSCSKEELMQHNRFETAVTILVGMGYPATIETVQEAYALLEDWPHSRRGTAHAVALRACRAALLGEIEAETARGLFVAFARKHDLLAPDPQGVVAARYEGNARRTAWR
jgi:hypothetical protein